jgi:phage terminase small subunit
MPEPLPVPDDLRDEGRALWSAVTSRYALRADELPLLAEMARTVDDLATMRAALAESGPVALGSKGQPRPNPLLAEVRGSRLLLVRLASQLGLPDEDSPAGATPASRKAARAANERWRREAVRYGDVQA